MFIERGRSLSTNGEKKSTSPPLECIAEMPASTLPRHGGSIALAEKVFGVPTQGWLDLSTGINPDAFSLPEVPKELWQQLPDSTLTDACIDMAAKYFGCKLRNCIVPGPGTQALIQWLPWLHSPSTTGIIGPTYTGHANAWQAAGHEVIEINDLPNWGDFATVIVTNPNNPDGRQFKAEDLESLSERQAHGGGLLVVDESFIDASPTNSVSSIAGKHGLIVLRSFGKFFGLAGLRLGFALADAETAETLRNALGPWPVSGPALEIGKQAMADLSWQQNMRISLKKRSEKMRELLGLYNFETLGGTPLFLLGSHPEAHSLYRHLARSGVLTRAFEGQPDRLRFGIPKDENDLIRTECALHQFGK